MNTPSVLLLCITWKHKTASENSFTLWIKISLTHIQITLILVLAWLRILYGFTSSSYFTLVRLSIIQSMFAILTLVNINYTPAVKVFLVKHMNKIHHMKNTQMFNYLRKCILPIITAWCYMSWWVYIWILKLNSGIIWWYYKS